MSKLFNAQPLVSEGSSQSLKDRAAIASAHQYRPPSPLGPPPTQSPAPAQKRSAGRATPTMESDDDFDPTAMIMRRASRVAIRRATVDATAAPGIGIRSIRFSPTSSDMFTATGDGYVGVYRMSDTNSVCTFRGVDHNGPVHDAQLTADNDRLVSCGEDTTVRVWDLESGATTLVLYGHTGPVVSLDLSHDNPTTRCITASLDGTARIWSLTDGSCLRTLTQTKALLAARFFPSGLRVAVAGADHDCVVYNVRNGDHLKRFHGHVGAIHSVEVSDDEQFVFTGSSDTSIRMWDVSTSNCVRVFNGHKDWVMRLRVCMNKQVMLALSRDCQLCVWNIPKAQLMLRLPIHGQAVGIDLSPDESILLTSRGDSTSANVWPLSVVVGRKGKRTANSFRA
jgi:WD40 repeat protein